MPQATPATPGRDKKMNQILKIVFNDDTTHERVEEFSSILMNILISYGFTAVIIGSEEECEEGAEDGQA